MESILSRGNGECGNPVSRIDSCTDDSRLSFKYQACPDIHGTESTVEELQCLATWKDGSTRYMVGKLSHGRVKTNEESYRCFVYERVQTHDRKVAYNVAQSGDATCNGLLSALEGSKVMRLTKVENAHTKCKYPTWITEHHHWHTLDYRKSYHFSHKNATLKITEDFNTGNPRSLTLPSTGPRKPNSEMRVVCHSEVKTESHFSIVVAHVTNGWYVYLKPDFLKPVECLSESNSSLLQDDYPYPLSGLTYSGTQEVPKFSDSGYICLAFHRRDSTVIELQQSTNLVQVPDDACSRSNFDPSKLPFVTLITASLHQRKCPHLGRYAIVGQSEGLEASGRTTRDVILAAKRVHRAKRDKNSLMEVEKVKDCDADKFESLNVGCLGGHDTMEFQSACGPDSDSVYSCHGSWEENGTYYLIASPVSRKSTEARRYCFISTAVYEGNGAGTGGKSGAISSLSSGATSDSNGKGRVTRLMMSTVAESCYRSVRPGISGIKAFNLSLVGQCAESKSAGTVSHITAPALLFLLAVLILIYGTR
ncbi:hypothetical protein RUM44_004209 [Polyplax serrata]|uniref:Uncharacterized protein n=1 Tax=Polyplax serrata TaxID=468196 RepID=A0ABR1B267_POLSC